MRFFQWTKDGYHKGNMLLSQQQIGQLLVTHDKKEEAYSTVQDYSEDGAITGCHLYFDIDSADLNEAYSLMADITFELELRFGQKNLVYFSGSKGFHVISPLYVKHSRCHEIVKMIALDMKIDVDMSVYRTKSWFRCNGTWNPKGEAYKVLVGPNDTLDVILENSKQNNQAAVQDFTRSILDVTSYADRLPPLNRNIQNQSHDFNKDITHCMHELWSMEEPPPGQAHHLAHIMARHCYRSNLSIDEAEFVFEDHPFKADQNKRDYEKVIASVYRYGHENIGCKYGKDADLLRDYCSKACIFNDEVSIFDLINWSSK